MADMTEVKRILHFSVSTWVNFLLGFFSTFILTRIFLPEVLGCVNLFYSTITTLLSIVCLGLDSAFIRFFNEPPKFESIPVFLFKLLSVCLLFLLLLAGVSYFIFGDDVTDFFLGKKETVLFVCIVIGTIDQIFLRFLNITYRMQMNIRQYNIQAILTNVITRISVIIGALIDSQSAIYAICANVLCMSILLVFYLIKQKQDWLPAHVNFDYSNYSEVVKFALYVALAGIIIQAYTLSSQLVIRNVIDTNAVGIYTSAALFTTILVVVKGGFASYWSAFMYANYNNENKQIFIKNVHRTVMLFSIVFCCLLFPFRRLLYLFIGENYRESMNFFSLVLSYPLLLTIQETTAYGIMIRKKAYISTITSGISLGINIGIGYLLTIEYGLIGMAWANFISAVVTFILSSVVGQMYYVSIFNKFETTLGFGLVLSVCISPVILYRDIHLVIFCVLILILSVLLYRDVFINYVKTIKSRF